MALEINEIKDKDQWNKFLLENNGHVIQSWEWGEFKATQGTPPVRLGLISNGELVASAQYTLHKVPFTNKFVGYLPKGPTLKTSSENHLSNLFRKLRNKAKEQGCMFIKMEPNIAFDNKAWLKILREENIPKSPKIVFADHNMLLDLSRSEEELLKNMHPKWRYNIRLAEKKGIKVNVEDSNASLEDFVTLMRKTAQRDQFFLHPESYYKKAFESLKKEGLAYLLIARIDKIATAAWMLFKFGETLYYPYGASNYEYRQYMSSHALMWESIKFGKRLKCTTFDLWGAASPEALENDPWKGFTKFKEGFGAQSVSYLGAYDLVADPIWYQIFNLADKTRWKILKWIKRT